MSKIIIKTIPQRRTRKQAREQKAILATRLSFKIAFPHTPTHWLGLVTVFYGDDPDPLWVAVKVTGPKSDDGFKTAKEFEQYFFEDVREWILERASHGIMYAPLNYTGEIWNPAFIKRLAKRLTRGRTKKAFGLEVLDKKLRENWKANGWGRLPRAKLFEKVKWLAQFVPKINANMVYKRAYDMGL